MREHSASATCYICSLAFAFLPDHVCFSVAHRTHGSVFSRNAREVKKPASWLSSQQHPEADTTGWLSTPASRALAGWLLPICWHNDTAARAGFFSSLDWLLSCQGFSGFLGVFWILKQQDDWHYTVTSPRSLRNLSFSKYWWRRGTERSQKYFIRKYFIHCKSKRELFVLTFSDRTQTSRNLFKPRLFPPPSVQSWPETNRALSAAQEISSDFFFFSFILVGLNIIYFFFLGEKVDLEFYCLSAVPPEPSGGWRCLHCVQCANYILVMCWMVMVNAVVVVSSYFVFFIYFIFFFFIDISAFSHFYLRLYV